jgi:glycosyltransferase involved in cell wall biosynthesis
MDHNAGLVYLVHHSPAVVGYEDVDELLLNAPFYRHYCEIATELGYDPELIVFGSERRTTTLGEFPVQVFPVTIGSSFGSELSAGAMRYLRRERPTVLHVNGCTQLNLIPLVRSCDAERIVLTHHGPKIPVDTARETIERRILCRYLFPAVDDILSVNEAELAHLRSDGVPGEKLQYFPNVVDTEQFSPRHQERCREELDIPVDDRCLVFVGRLVPLKGASDLIRALGRLSPVPDNLTVTLVYGAQTDDEYERVRGLVEDSGLGDVVDLVGAVDHDRLPLYYNAADVAVFPSRLEGFGIVTIEAMACETPVVATTAHLDGGHIDPDENALVASAGEPDDIAATIEQLLEDPEQRARIAENGRLRVQRDYTTDRLREIFAEIYPSQSATHDVSRL